MRPIFRSNIKLFSSSSTRPVCLRHTRPPVFPSAEENAHVENVHVENVHVENAVDTAAAGSAPAVDGKGRCLLCREETLTARRYRCKLVVGLIFPFALQALDVTMLVLPLCPSAPLPSRGWPVLTATSIASALPWIATDFGRSSPRSPPSWKAKPN